MAHGPLAGTHENRSPKLHRSVLTIQVVRARSGSLAVAVVAVITRPYVFVCVTVQREFKGTESVLRVVMDRLTCRACYLQTASASLRVLTSSFRQAGMLCA
jgi:hypothetical protein